MIFTSPLQYAGLRIIFDANALGATSERLFPASRNRSARIRKKLIKRHGGEFRMRPCMWVLEPPAVAERCIVAHPSLRPQLEAELQRNTQHVYDNMVKDRR